MATNYVQPGKQFEIATADGLKSGDPFVAGTFLPCVLLTDAGADPYMATVQTEGVFNLSVKAHDGGSNSAVVVGDALYWQSGEPLDKDDSETFFGVALEGVDSGETETIPVLITTKAVTTSLAKFVSRPLTAPDTDGDWTVATSGVVTFNISGETNLALALQAPAFAGQELTILFNKETAGTGDVVITGPNDMKATDDVLTLDTEGDWAKLLARSNNDTLEWRVIADDGAGWSST